MSQPRDGCVLIMHVSGTPAPQGSKAYKGLRGGKPVLVESSAKVRPWRAAVEACARAEMAAVDPTWHTLDEPVRLDVQFRLAAPQRMPRGRRGCDRYPDLSKLIRSTEDALVTAGVIADDARIVTIHASKEYASSPVSVGATITIGPALSTMPREG